MIAVLWAEPVGVPVDDPDGMLLDPNEPPPGFFEAAARWCRCCRVCGSPPCAGACAGGMCDQARCSCDDDYGDDLYGDADAGDFDS